jgi:hypothetical protein
MEVEIFSIANLRACGKFPEKSNWHGGNASLTSAKSDTGMWDF